MMRSFLLTLWMCLLGAAGVSAQTVLTGKVKDADTKEDLIGATIKVLRGSDIVRGGVTNFDGEYRFPLDAGTYDLEVSYTGYQTQRTNGVKVLVGQINFLDIQLSSGTVIGGGQDLVVIKEYKVPLIKKDETSGGQTLTSETIKNLPTRSVNAIVATTAGTSSIDGGAINIKGSRTNATNYYIDGIRVSGSAPPVQDIEQLQVITGGLGAEFGDVTGGVVSIVTKGPAGQYHGSVDVENSYGLDPYGWLLGTANVSGPLVKRKKADGTKVPLIGFRASVQYLGQKDDDPPALKVARAKPEVLAALSEHPLTLFNGNVVNSGELLTTKDVDYLSYRPNEEARDIDFTGKLDFRLTDNIDFQLTGTYRDSDDKSTPTGSGGWDDNNWLLLNSQNNPTQYDNRWRTIGRFRHRLGSSDAGTASKTRKVSISNAYYQLQFGFERATSLRESPIHQDRLSDYGYIGNFKFNYVPIGGVLLDTIKGLYAQQIDTREEYAGYTPSEINASLVKYNEFATDNGNYNDVRLVAKNGRFTNIYNGLWAGMHRNINYFYNLNEKQENDILTVSATSGFDLKLGNTGTHNIQFGLLHEQRKLNKHSIAPYTLWELAYQKANAHINGIDTTKEVGKFWAPGISEQFDSLSYFENTIVELGDQKFYKKVREVAGVDLKDYINVHGLSPDQLKLDMFGASEIFNFTDLNLDYYGYDYLGNKNPAGITFNDFFTSKDKDGIRNFPIAAFQPLYQAAYFKDKFTFKDIIFSLGLRVERFDLNTKVLKDPYSLYEIMSADEYFRTVSVSGPRPSGIGDDFKVYVKSKSDLTPRAYRNGDTWYSTAGVQQNDGNLVIGQSVIEPLLKDTIVGDNILDTRFDPNSSFKDYDPQLVWLPRLAFSFPISDNANFFAHYDVLVQRPPGGRWQVSPLDYVLFYIPNRRSEANANLRPERVVDYEVGFQQKLNNYSALKFSAYYREMRDMVQLQYYNFVPTITSYTTFGNQDFGTTKGFTMQYDLRRIQNFEARVSYTLQFADGTGSTDESQRQLVKLGNNRYLSPLDYDERHNIAAILDYRFDSGKAYNGPRVGGKDILSQFGLNVQINTASGRPYTAKDTPRRFEATGTGGTINGSRLPWRNSIDLRVDKSFNLTKAGDKNPLNMNIYFRVSNVLNRKNVLSVNGYTGSATDDGYLVTQQGSSTIPTDARATAYLSSYSWALLDPNRFTLPRRMYVGMNLSF